MRLRYQIILIIACGFAGFAVNTRAQDAPAPPSNVVAADRPNDVGESVNLTWTLSPDDEAETMPRRVMSYNIYRKLESDGSSSEKPESTFSNVGDATYQSGSFTDPNVERGETYTYHLTAVSPTGVESIPSAPSNQVTPVMQFFDMSKAWFGIILLMVGGAVVYFIESAKRGKTLKVRKIAGLEAVTEAVGRATEMGRPVLFIPGIQDINDIQTIAGITILGNVAQTCAEYDARLEVPTARSLVMTTARETVQNAFLAAGRPDAYNEDSIYYLTDEQFGYVAGVMGTMVREKPAACFYLGAFYAESLILAETGNGIGAIQIAGTAMPSQLPFFVAACDYTLIGEEFFAASAYLSGEPHQLGSLKGQDVGKLIGALVIIIGCLLATFGQMTKPNKPGAEDNMLTRSAHYLSDNVMGNKGLAP